MLANQVGTRHTDERCRFDDIDGRCRFMEGRTRGGSLPLAALIGNIDLYMSSTQTNI
jgi:hypothetical protein